MSAICRVCLLLICLGLYPGHAQPVANSKQTIDGIEVYRDLSDERVFYYAPGELGLSIHSNERPEFQLIELRYTGSSAYGDQGAKRFLNVVQFGVSMQQMGAVSLNAVRRQLGAGAIDLRPLPIRGIDAFLVVPVGDANEKGGYKKLGKDGSFQAESNEGLSGAHGFWTERNFTLKLENHEAQLLWDQVSNGQLSMTLSYTFYADMVQGLQSQMDVSGDGVGKVADELVSRKEELDTASREVMTQIVKADAFPIRVDVVRWPDLLKKLDINEGIPPGYAALEVRCFDFANDLRPDLAVKGIDIMAVGVGGRVVSLPTQKFLRSEPDLYAKQIRFPYAVKLTEPYQYRIIEYTADGEKVLSPWQKVTEWSSHLDITTPSKENLFLHRQIDFELSPAELKEKAVSKVQVRVDYTFAGKAQHQLVSFELESLPIKQINFNCDKDRSVTYYIEWTFADETTKISEARQMPEDNYVYIGVPE